MKRRRKNRKLQKQINKSGKGECPICHEKAPLEEHHIEGRDIPNPNYSSNLCYICPNCHTRTHLGLIVIEGHFQTTKGLELFWHEGSEESFTGKDAKPYTY